jgi:hypothetical protein
VDFFTVPTVTFKVLFVFVVLGHHRRRVVQCNHSNASAPAKHVDNARYDGSDTVEANARDTPEPQGVGGAAVPRARRADSTGTAETVVCPATASAPLCHNGPGYHAEERYTPPIPFLSFAKTPSGGPQVELSALIRRHCPP